MWLLEVVQKLLDGFLFSSTPRAQLAAGGWIRCPSPIRTSIGDAFFATKSGSERVENGSKSGINNHVL